MSRRQNPDDPTTEAYRGQDSRNGQEGLHLFSALGRARDKRSHTGNQAREDDHQRHQFQGE
jgi:hypothetical protein